ncbi:MAG: hypothetical protein LBR17_02525 [Bacteroidales bacterium]|jgi:hypothetical protein|nr:hypothetical protein [Bacteroidales bacterium]
MKNLFNKMRIFAIIFVSLAVTVFVACDSDEENNDNPVNSTIPTYYGVTNGQGWPSSRLGEFGLGSLTQPSGLSNITYWYYDGTGDGYYDYDYPAIYITGTANQATFDAVNNQLSSIVGESYFVYGNMGAGEWNGHEVVLMLNESQLILSASNPTYSK